MIKKMLLAAMTAASVTAPAWADVIHNSTQGHYEWRSVPQFGPRATGPARVRVWVPEAREMASCDCAMMQTSAAGCMNGALKPNNG